MNLPMSIKKSCHLIILLAFALPALLSGCNKKSEDIEEKYTPASNVAVTAFSLKANSTVAPKLDSVYFAIDLRAGIIFNADSLPAGTDVSALVPVITYPSSITGATITTVDGNYDYMASPGTELNFTEPATLKLTSQDGSTSASYTIKVNVHQQNPAQFLWSEQSLTRLPGAASDPAKQKTLTFGTKTLCYVQTQSGEILLSATDTANPDSWTTETLNMNFTPELRTLTASSDRLYILGTDGELFSSADGRIWSDCNQKWECITGAYLQSITGIRNQNGQRIHTAWPAGTLPESVADPEFPVSGFTNAGSVTTEWSPWPTIFVYGGCKSDGSLSDAAWAFDGESWTTISSGKTLKVTDAMLIPYWLSRPTSTMWLTDDRDAWLLVGGTLEDGEPNRKVWYSFDNGITWFEGAETMDMPGRIPGLAGADAIVHLQSRSASAEEWRKAPRRLNTVVEGTTILWECPEIYIFGGNTPGGLTYNTVWRTVLARFTFTPII